MFHNCILTENEEIIDKTLLVQPDFSLENKILAKPGNNFSPNQGIIPSQIAEFA